MKDTVVIMGSHPRTRKDFDFSRTDCDVWIFNEALSNGTFPRADATFQMHDEVIWKNPANRNDKGYSEWLKRDDIPPVYMQKYYPEIPQSVQYPLDGIMKMTSNFEHNKFITSSPAYGIALAVYKGYKRIEIYGVEMETQTEYMYQRAGIAYWVGVAIGKGIEVRTPTNIFQEPLYGYEGRITVEYDDFVNRIAELEPIVEQKLEAYKKRREFTVSLMDNIVATGKEPERLFKSIQDQTSACTEFGFYDGARQENERYKGKLDEMKKIADGKYLIVRQEYEQSASAQTKAHNESILKAQMIQKEMDVLYEDLKGVSNALRRRGRMQKFAEKLNALLAESTKVGMFHGAMAENQRYMDKLDHFIRAAGGSKSEEVMAEAGVEA